MKGLLEVQLATDAALLKARPELLARKHERMSASPFAFLRGAFTLWSEVLKREPGLLAGLPGEGTLVGDLHLENFGTFLTANGWLFHVNDFDETRQGPWAWDVLRLLTSIELAADPLGGSAKKACRLALDAYCDGGPGAPPHAVERLLSQAARTPSKKLYAKRLESRTKLKAIDRQPPAPAPLVREVPRALELWRRSLPTVEAVAKKSVEVLDVRRRITGCGSLGVERLVVLARGDAGGPWIIELKAARGCVASDVVEAMRQCLPEPPFRFGSGLLGGTTVMVHPLAPGEAKLEAVSLGAHGFEQLARYAGSLSAECHRRGASGDFDAWGHHAQRDVLERASYLANLHREAFAAFKAKVARRR